MKTLKVELTNCHGIRSFDATLDFGDRNAVGIYAPNGTMKTSFARTFKDFATGKETTDRVFPDRESSRLITDENGQSPDPAASPLSCPTTRSSARRSRPRHCS